MTKSGNIINASDGRVLKCNLFDGARHEIILGKGYYPVNGKIVLIEVKLRDIKEVYAVVIDNEVYYIESTTYPEAVTELIRLKYSLDDELALMANARLGINEDLEKLFLAWRIKCKEAAKNIFK